MDIPEVKLNRLDIQNLESKLRLYKYIYFGNKLKYYEEIVKTFGNIIKIKVNENKRRNFEKINEELLLDVNIDQIESSAIFLLILFIFIGIIPSIIISPLYFLLFASLGVLFYILIDYYYIILYNNLNTRKKSQLISLLLLLAIKLRQNPNVEQAILFAAKNINLPLKLDLLRLLRDVYNRKYISASEALIEYSRSWEKNAKFFYIGVMLILSALYDPDKDRRNFQIDKSIEEALEELVNELYEFSREIRSTINLVSMLGITLPVMLLTIFPLASIFLGNIFSPFVLFILFDILIPFIAFFSINYAISSRMISIFSEDDIYLFYYLKRKDLTNKLISIASGFSVGILLFFIIFFVIYQYLYKFDVLGVLLSEFFVLLMGLSISLMAFTYYSHYKDLYKSLEKIEMDLPPFLLSLSSALNEGYPLEKAMIHVYSKYKGGPIGDFISKIYQNLRMGLSFYDSIFDIRYGALSKIPSSKLRSTMELLYEASSQSPTEASVITGIIAKYFLLISKVKERIKDLVAEDLSQLKSLLRILAPIILGIVSAVGVMVIEILHRLSFQFSQVSNLTSPDSNVYQYINSLPNIIFNIFNLNSLISPSSMIIIIGIFNAAIAFVIIYAINSIENSGDKLGFYYYLYKYYIINILMFFIFSTISTIALYMFVHGILNINYLI
ncbi:MAG: type II secretion system F family protein [Candidatus Nanopusillus sp.]|nr:type II secretion system F family protein [Candidatus Nanopusillus sp.]